MPVIRVPSKDGVCSDAEIIDLVVAGAEEGGAVLHEPCAVLLLHTGKEGPLCGVRLLPVRIQIEPLIGAPAEKGGVARVEKQIGLLAADVQDALVAGKIALKIADLRDAERCAGRRRGVKIIDLCLFAQTAAAIEDALAGPETADHGDALPELHGRVTLRRGGVVAALCRIAQAVQRIAFGGHGLAKRGRLAEMHDAGRLLPLDPDDVHFTVRMQREQIRLGNENRSLAFHSCSSFLVSVPSGYKTAPMARRRA